MHNVTSRTCREYVHAYCAARERDAWHDPGCFDAVVPHGLLRGSVERVRVAEGGGDVPSEVSYTLRLTSAPLADVTVSLQLHHGHCLLADHAWRPQYNRTCSADADCGAGQRCKAHTKATVLPQQVVFRAEEWHEPAAVSVQALDDWLVEPTWHASAVLHVAASADALFHGAVLAVPVLIRDNDHAALLVEPRQVAVREGEPARAYSVRLASEPWAEVELHVGADPALLHVTPSGVAALRLAPDDWHVARNVTVEALDDEVDRGDDVDAAITHSLQSLDEAYGGMNAPAVAVRITDNDRAALLWSVGEGEAAVAVAVAVAEGGAAAQLHLALATRPAASPVRVQLAATAGHCLAPGSGRPHTLLLCDVPAQCEAALGAGAGCRTGSKAGVAPETVVFDASNWAQPVGVEVEAVDDWLVEGPHFTRLHASLHTTDAAYAALRAPPLVINITDNDRAGLRVHPRDVRLSAPRAPAAYAVSLLSEPWAAVSVAALYNDTLLHASPALPLVFAPGDWQRPMEVALQAIAAPLAELPDVIDVTIPVRHEVQSLDADYAASPPSAADVLVHVRLLPDRPPVVRAAAGAAAITVPASSVTLNASASSAAPGASVQAFAWRQTAGPAAAALVCEQLRCSVARAALEVPGEYTFQVTVTDDQQRSSNGSVRVLLNRPPVARTTGDVLVTWPRADATVSAAASEDPEGGPLRFEWVLVAGEGTVVAPAQAATAVRELRPGVAALRVTVTDEHGASAAAEASVLVNLPPVASAGPSVTLHASPDAAAVFVTLDASNSSDADDGVAAFSWRHVAGVRGEEVVVAHPDRAITAARLPTAHAVHVFRVTVTDTRGAQDEAEVQVTVMLPVSVTSQHPLLNVRVNHTAALHADVTLDGGGEAQVAWELLSAPPGAGAPALTPVGSSAGDAFVTRATLAGLSLPGDYTVRVTVHREPPPAVAVAVAAAAAADGADVAPAALTASASLIVRAVHATASRPAGSAPCVVGGVCELAWETHAPSGASVTLALAADARLGAAVVTDAHAVGSTAWVVPDGTSVTPHAALAARVRLPAGWPPVLEFAPLPLRFEIGAPYAYRVGGWGACVPQCGVGAGTQWRAVTCLHAPSQHEVPHLHCMPWGGTAPSVTRACALAPCTGTGWSAGVWGACSAACGPSGSQARVVQCVDAAANALPDSACLPADRPPAQRACNRAPCPTFSWRASLFGQCSAPCGGGTRFRSVYCAADATGAPAAADRCAGQARPADREACNTHACAEHVWVAGAWSGCSVACDSGVRRRQVRCVTGGSGEEAASEALCAASASPAAALACNTQPCVMYAFEVGPWQHCSAECGAGQQQREVTCTDSLGREHPLSVCAQQLSSLRPGGVLMPAATIQCHAAPCDPCAGELCSGRGRCEAGRCQCAAGFSGAHCERAAHCAGGVTDAQGTCCPSGLLDRRARCCGGSAPALDARGECCVSGRVDACGVCNGAARVVDALGACCASVLDAKHLCCDSGTVDACGVCDGHNECNLRVQAAGLVAAEEEAAVAGTAARESFEAQLRESLAEALAVAPAQIVLRDVREEAAAASSHAASLSVTAAAAAATDAAATALTVELDVRPGTDTAGTPFEGEVADALAGMGATVLSATRAGTCGNGVCETGEGCPGDHCCATDCPFAMLSCPVPPGASAPCGGHGRCMPATGVCECFTASGYAAGDCSQCATGWLAVDGRCMRALTSQSDDTGQGDDTGHVTTSEHAPSTRRLVVVVALASAGGAAALAALAVVVSLCRAARPTSHRARIVAVSTEEVRYDSGHGDHDGDDALEEEEVVGEQHQRHQQQSGGVRPHRLRAARAGPHATDDAAFLPVVPPNLALPTAERAAPSPVSVTSRSASPAASAAAGAQGGASGGSARSRGVQLSVDTLSVRSWARSPYSKLQQLPSAASSRASSDAADSPMHLSVSASLHTPELGGAVEAFPALSSAETAAAGADAAQEFEAGTRADRPQQQGAVATGDSAGEPGSLRLEAVESEAEGVDM